MSVHAHMTLRPSILTKLRGCFGGKRRNLPFWFGAVYDGVGKHKVGVSVSIGRAEDRSYAISLVWFRTTFGPPANFAKFSDFVTCLEKPFGEQDTDVSVNFSFKADEVESVFQPITIAEHPAIFDEIVGFSGVKRDSHRKLLYRMDISVSSNKVEHTIQFRQITKLTYDMPLALIETASKISNLAVKPKQKT